MIEEFKSAEELYQRILPALKSKVSEMKREGYSYFTPEDIWNYLKENKWVSSTNLTLNEMVSDIFSADGVLIDDFLKGKLQKRTRRVYFLDEE